MAAQYITNTFLELPVEVRSQVLRRLLVCTSVLIPFSSWPDMYPQILRVSRQLYAEGIDLLYGQNVFHMHIHEDYDDDGIVHAEFMKCWNFVDDVDCRIPQYRRIQHYDVRVEMTSGDGEDDDYLPLRCLVRRVAIKMSGLPSLKHLRITVDTIGLQGCDDVLHAFTLLSNVGYVEVQGVEASYAQYLKTAIEGPSRLDRFPKMSSMLDHLGATMNEYERVLEHNLSTLHDRNVNEYLWIRAELLEKLVVRTQQALTGVFKEKADSHDGLRWFIEQKHGSSKSRRY